MLLRIAAVQFARDRDTPCVLLDANKREAEPTLKERAERKRKKAADTSATQKAAVKDAGLQFCSGSDNYDKSRSDGEFDVASKKENDSEDVEQENEPPQQSKVSAKTSKTIEPALRGVNAAPVCCWIPGSACGTLQLYHTATRHRAGVTSGALLVCHACAVALRACACATAARQP